MYTSNSGKLLKNNQSIAADAEWCGVAPRVLISEFHVPLLFDDYLYEVTPARKFAVNLAYMHLNTIYVVILF